MWKAVNKLPEAQAEGGTDEKHSFSSNIDQANKSTGWMPWHQELMKDAANCEKPGGVVSGRYIPGYPNGGTRRRQHSVTI